MTDLREFSYDILVIGAGGSGLRTAIEAAGDKELRVGMVSKSLLGKAHTVMAEGGIAAALSHVDDRDNWQVHFADTMRGGQYLNNWQMAEIHAQEAPERVRELEAWGALFDRTKDGRMMQRNFGGHKYPRLVHVGDRTGLEIIRSLQDHAIHYGVSFHMETTVLTLLKSNGKIAGALGYDRQKGDYILFKCKAIILATGGVGRIFKITSNSWECTGDGIALAFQAGAALRDMEFIQFHPTGMVWPPSIQGMLVTEGVRGEGGILTNSEGRRFMFDDIPEPYRHQTSDNAEEGWRYTQGDKSARRPPELLTRDHVARCIVRQIKSGKGSPHGGVFLDISWIRKKIAHAPKHIIKKLPSMYHQFKQLADVDITRQPMEVGPTTHYMMGGIQVDARSQMTNVPGLFACGECASGLHGANRLGGNSLSDLLVFGKRAGEFSRLYAKKAKWGKIDPKDLKNVVNWASAFFSKGGRNKKENPFEVMADLRELMQNNVGIVRDEKELKIALAKLKVIQSRIKNIGVAGNVRYNPAWHTAMDLPNMLTIARAITMSAVERKESRGAHFREDYPQKDKKYATFNICLAKGGGDTIKLVRQAIPKIKRELQEIIEENNR